MSSVSILGGQLLVTGCLDPVQQTIHLDGSPIRRDQETPPELILLFRGIQDYIKDTYLANNPTGSPGAT